MEQLVGFLKLKPSSFVFNYLVVALSACPSGLVMNGESDAVSDKESPRSYTQHPERFSAIQSWSDGNGNALYSSLDWTLFGRKRSVIR